LSFWIVFFKPLRPNINDVILSNDLDAAAPLIIISTPSAAA
jgi:hypothetical protein